MSGERMISEPHSAILGGAIGGLIGGVLAVLGVCLAYYLGRRGSEVDRRAEKQFTLYLELEVLATLLVAYQKQMIDPKVFHRKWARTTERIIGGVLNSGVDRKWVLDVMNGKWEKPESVTAVQALADEIMEKIDPEYSRALRELERETGVKRSDIDPIILSRE
jgi:hypothetical protein